MSLADWEGLANEIANAYKADERLAACVADAEGLEAWFTADAVDTFETALEVGKGILTAPTIASMLATHSQIGFELGVAAARRGLVLDA